MRSFFFRWKVWPLAMQAAILWLAIALPMPPLMTQAGQDGTTLAGEVPVTRLLDLCAERLGFVINYDDRLLQDQSFRLRGTEALGDEAIWILANQLLASRGLTTVAMSATAEADRPQFTVVKLTEAASMARIEADSRQPPIAGYALLRIEIKSTDAKSLVEWLTPQLSKPGGTVQQLGSSRQIVVGELSSRLPRLLEFIRTADAQNQSVIIQSYAPQFITAAQLVASVTAASLARSTIGGTTFAGKVVPAGDGEGVLVITPELELETWLALIEQCDQRRAVQTNSYIVPAFELDEVAALIEQVGREQGPRGSGDQWRVIRDSLTSMLMVTATPHEHGRIQEFMDRLTAIPRGDRRPVRSFAIRNRNVSEIIEVLKSLLEAGVFEAGEFEPSVDADGPAGAQRETRSPGPTPSASVASGHHGPESAGHAAASVELEQAPAERGSPDQPDRHEHGSDPSRGHAAISFTADVGTNTLIAVGEPRMLAQIEELLKTLDVRQPQVMVEVLVVSLNESDTKDLGVELEKIELSGGTVIRVASLFGFGTPGISNPDQALQGQGFSGLILNPGDFRVLIRALQTLNNGRALNVPKVLVNNNQQATLDAVLQQPFVSTNASTTVATTSFGGFENAGTTVTVRPQIARGDHLVVEYAVMLSAFVGDSSDPGIPPPRQQNKLQSVVTIPDGYTVALGGIEVRSEGDSVSQIPLLGDVPFIGELFKDRSKSESISKFFVFIRPSVMRHEGFEDLKFLSDDQWKAAEMRADELYGAFEGWPDVKPQVIR